MSNKLNETFTKHLGLLRQHLKPTLNESRMKDLAMDLEELSDDDFKRKYGKTKSEIKASLGMTEGNDNLVSMIERYVKIIETLKSISLSRDGGDPDLEDEKKQIKNQIISSKGQEYFNMVDEFVELKVRKGNHSEVESLANQLGLPQLALSEVTTEGSEPSGLRGAEVIDVMTSSDGKVHLRLKGSNSTQLYDAILV